MFRIRTALAGAVVAAAAVLMIAAPASAHDQEVSSSPANGAQLTTVPTQVSVSFSENLSTLADNNGAAMTVKDAAGTDWVAGAPVVAANTVTAQLKPGMPNGVYNVTWKVTSSDGHPTSNPSAYTFTVAAPAPSPTASIAPSEAPSAAPSVVPLTQSPAATQTNPLQWPLLIGLGIVVLIAIILVIVIAARKKR